GMMTQYGMQPLGIFELTPLGIPILIVGLVYMYFIGDRLIPDRTPVGDEKQQLTKRMYLTEMVVEEYSAFVGKTLEEAKLGSQLQIQVLRVIRERHRYLIPTADVRLEAGDVLIVEAGRSEILKVKDMPGVQIKADFKFGDLNVDPDGIGIFEVILVPGSPFIGRTLRGLHARDRYNLQVLAINRHGEPIRGKLSTILMQLGDVLLIQGARDNIEVLEQEATFTTLDATVDQDRPDLRRAPRAVLIFVGALVLAALEIVPIPIAALGGAVLAFATRCITPEEAYRQVEWKVLILIGSMLALGQAIEQTGTAAFLAQQIVAWVGHMPVFFLLSAFFVLTVVLTQPLSNQAAAAVVLPVAVRTALQLDLDPRTFAVMIAIAASSGFLTPLEPACVIIYGAGRYRFMDFLRVGALLTVVIYGIVIVLVPLLWPPVAA
ncbi:MAG: anion permease, partial [Anaerolineae bacterium]|nr:anion permease [Anaerolineae bacterium]